MPDKVAIIDTFYDAWNRHDVAAIVDPFAADGLYADPLTRIGVHGDSLTAHVEPFVVRDGRLIIGQHRYAGRKAEAVIEALGVQTTDSKERTMSTASKTRATGTV